MLMESLSHRAQEQAAEVNAAKDGVPLLSSYIIVIIINNVSFLDIFQVEEHRGGP